jgi:hypothetical protein
MGDQFGESVALSGDTAVVGAAFEDSSAAGVGGDQINNGADNSGAAYVFVRNGATWSQHAYLKASNTESGDKFGDSVTVSIDTVAAAARHEDSNATGVDGNQRDNSAADSGAANVFSGLEPADFNNDGIVNGADLGVLLGLWGPCEGCPVDLDKDGFVDETDLSALLADWS